MTRSSLVAAAALSALAALPSALAQRAPARPARHTQPARPVRPDSLASPVDLVAAIAPEPGAARSAASAVLVGRSGQLYLPAGELTWQRRAPGGVAVDLRAAWRSPHQPSEVIAAPRRAPPFRFRAGTWRAEPLTSGGALTLSRTGAVPALAAGRHIFLREKNAWVRRASAGGTVSALWAAGPRELLVATGDGLARWNGRRFTAVRTPLSADDRIELLLGASPRQVYGRARSGAWIRIDRAGTAAMSLTPELEGFDEEAAGLAPDGVLLLAGTRPAVDGTRAPVLARAEGNRLLPWDKAPALAAGDRFAVVWSHPPSGEILIATASGAVHLRGKDGAWRTGRVRPELPVPRGATTARGSAPARAR